MDKIVKLRVGTKSKKNDLSQIRIFRTMTFNPIIAYGTNNSNIMIEALESGADIYIPDDMGERERIARTNKLLERC